MLLVQMKIVKTIARLIMEISLVMEHTRQKMVKYINFIAKHVKKALLQTQTLFYMYLRTNEKGCVHML
jgi:hypothetical protein